MELDTNDWLGWRAYVSGEYEPATSAVIHRLLAPGDTAVDVGAHVGYFTLLAGCRVGGSGRVFAFEPVPATSRTLMRNVRLNRLMNVTVGTEAVSDARGERTLYEGPANHTGLSSLRHLGGHQRTLRVVTARLDDLLPSGAVVRLVKIDAEGAEDEIVRGMSALIERCRPDVVVEVTDGFLRALGNSGAELCSRLAASGYRMYAIEGDGLTPLSGWSADLPEQFNALFTARDRLPGGVRVRASGRRYPSTVAGG